MKVSGNPTLQCTLEEFFNEHLRDQPQQSENLEGLSNFFRGKATVTPRFKIKCEECDVFFNNRELLCRFTAMGTPSQKRFIQAIWAALIKHKVDRIEIAIPWSAHGIKRLQINMDGGVNLELI